MKYTKEQAERYATNSDTEQEDFEQLMLQKSIDGHHQEQERFEIYESKLNYETTT